MHARSCFFPSKCMKYENVRKAHRSAKGLKHEGIIDFIFRNAQRNFAPGLDNLSYAPGYACSLFLSF